MRFSDIKKFWETRLGGQSNKASRTSAITSRKNESLCEKKSNLSTKKKSIEGAVATRNGSKCDKNEQCKHTRALSANVSGNLPSHTKACKRTQSLVVNDGAAEERVHSIVTKAVDACSSSYRLKGEQDKSVFNYRLFKQESETESHCFNIASHVESCVGENTILKETVVCSSKKNSPKGPCLIEDNSIVSNVINSERNLSELSAPGIGILSPNSDSVSAPPSMYNSPCKTMQTNCRYLQSNMKFNELQSFWLKKEKQLFKRSIEDRV